MNETILVVDDNQLNLRLLKDILQDEDYEVITASNGSPVLDICKQVHPDVVLLDIMMPGIDGFEVCKLLKANIEVADIPVIMVTAKTDGNDIKHALECGAYDYIKKPIDEVEVIARIQAALRAKHYQDSLKELAIRDSLTNIYNHKILIEFLEKELSVKHRNNNTMAFLMLDIDHFKDVNDVYGHLTGDFVVAEIADILKNTIRDSDILGRYGGEEFGIILSKIDKENAYKFSERIRNKIAGHDFDLENDIVKITVSIGMFFINENDMSTTYEIIQKADDLLYKAKKKGRNRVETNS